MKLYRFSQKGDLAKRVWEYKKRREVIRERYGYKPEGYRGKASNSYKRAVFNINTKISYWNRKMRELTEMRNKIETLGRAIKEYTGYNVKNSYSDKDRQLNSARKLFAKYGMENGIPGVLLGEYIGNDKKHYTAELRERFNTSIPTHPENSDLYIRFQRYMEDIEASVIINSKNNKTELVMGSADSQGEAEASNA